MDTETTPCVVCGSTTYTLRFRLHDWAYELPGEFQLVTCSECGHIYQTPRPSQSAMGAFYPDDYQPFRRTIAEEPHALFRAWRHLQWRNRCMQVARLRRGGSLLDIGASTGLFLNELRHYGQWKLVGVELNEHAARYAREIFGLEMFTGQVVDVPWPPASFDVITCWDVLEHLPDPRIALLRMHELLKEDGYLIVSVPNVGSLDAQLFGQYWIGLDPPRHLSVFSRTGLERLMRETGFLAEATYCFYGRYTTFALSVQQWLRAKLPRSPLRRAVERVLFLPFWRFLALPYFWVLDQMRLGAIMTVRARPLVHE